MHQWLWQADRKFDFLDDRTYWKTINREKDFNIIHHLASEVTMKNLWKSLALVGVGVLDIVGIMLIAKAARHRRQAGRYEKLAKSIEEKLVTSKDALDKATAYVQSVFEQIKNVKI